MKRICYLKLHKTTNEEIVDDIPMKTDDDGDAQIILDSFSNTNDKMIFKGLCQIFCGLYGHVCKV